jgi:hypothetical protein
LIQDLLIPLGIKRKKEEYSCGCLDLIGQDYLPKVNTATAVAEEAL